MERAMNPSWLEILRVIAALGCGLMAGVFFVFSNFVMQALREQAQFFFTATIALAPHGNGTRYTATVTHADEAGCQQHAAMGFEGGWGKALEQLVEYTKKM
jgi:Activator of Hsp90 ATPase homolog 1-like protein